MSTVTYKNVLLVGGTGTLGKHILSALLADSTINVTVFSRSDSASTFPSTAKVIKVDYSDKAGLVKALAGQDVVISAIGGPAIAANIDLTLVEAALAAGVKWFIPSEFGIDTSHPSVATNPIAAPKIACAELLKKNQSRIAHTLIYTGAFLEWGFANGFSGFDLANHTATLYDEGKHLVSGSTFPHIGQAVVKVLHHPELTLNKRIYIADAIFTQQQALSLLEKHTGAKWTVKQVTTESLLKQGAEAFAKGNIMQGVQEFILNMVYNGQGSVDFTNKTSNKALGIEQDSLEHVIKQALDNKKVAH